MPNVFITLLKGPQGRLLIGMPICVHPNVPAGSPILTTIVRKYVFNAIWLLMGKLPVNFKIEVTTLDMAGTIMLLPNVRVMLSATVGETFARYSMDGCVNLSVRRPYTTNADGNVLCADSASVCGSSARGFT
ncbi:hypothetical protein GGF31_004279 [Allomyces arbusculus]|nr:hypothetical protein GGF31_004279 [Allomyces arbusculus]